MNDNLFDYKTYFRSPDSGPILLTTKKKKYIISNPAML